jgi:hypothetical protein
LVCLVAIFLLFLSQIRFFIFFCSQDSQELFDAELAARVLQLINITDTGVHAQVRWNLFCHLTWMASCLVMCLQAWWNIGLSAIGGCIRSIGCKMLFHFFYRKNCLLRNTPVSDDFYVRNVGFICRYCTWQILLLVDSKLFHA